MVAQYRKASPAEINSINTPKRANRVAMKSRDKIRNLNNKPLAPAGEKYRYG